MNCKEFFDAYLGLWVETNKGTDSSTWDQCIDAFRIYNRKVIGASDIFGNPPDIWINYQIDFYDKIPNTPTGFPQLGDVIIWGNKYSKYGHIAVCTDIADTKTFTSFDQNDPVGTSCHYQPHNYTGVLGWLRPKNQTAVIGQPSQSEALQVIVEAHNALPDNDSLKQENLKDYCQKIIEEHKTYSEYQKKAEILNGFIAKWVQKYNLNTDSDLIDIESEMAKLMPLEEWTQKLREEIEKVVGSFEKDDALILAIQAIKTDKETLIKELNSCQTKLAGRKILYAFQIGKYLIKIFSNPNSNPK